MTRLVYQVIDWLLMHSPWAGRWETSLISRDPEFSALLRERMAEGYRKHGAVDLATAEELLPFSLSTLPPYDELTNSRGNTRATGPLNGESFTTWTRGPRF